jgi:hypothetical protein
MSHATFTSARTRTVLRTSAALALALAGLAGQAAHADSLNPVLGGGLGAMAGALIGQSMGGRDGAMVGAAVGGVAGVSIASNGERRRPEPVRTVVYDQPYRAAPVYVQPARVYVAPAPVYVAPAYGYRTVERVSYYPVREYGRHGWGEHGRGIDERRWEHRDGYRPDGYRGDEHRGWDRRD